MKNLVKRALSLLFLLTFTLPLLACSDNEEYTEYGNLTLRICNWEDYIAEDDDGVAMWQEFESWYEQKHGVDITVEYSTFGTPEILYNNLKINPGCYDLICPSDYMIQKMIEEGMLDTFDIVTQIPNYDTYASGYLKNLFEEKGWTSYALPYMWGTMGFIYNPEEVPDEDAFSWACAVDDKYFNKTTIKDSVRDTYFLGVALARLDYLSELNEKYTSSAITKAEYQATLAATFNDTSEEMVNSVEQVLKKAKQNAFSIEVDSGKDDMVTGKVHLNFAWSGDAVYAMDEAEESGLILNYAVPKEGSNIWFDGWCMPKGANTKLACAFLDYISDPEKAWENMEYIGYTSAIAGDYVFDRVLETYDVGADAEGAEEVDLSYYFDNISRPATLYVDERNRQFDAQYPNESITTRCTIMDRFTPEQDKRINDMWNRVKAGEIGLYLIVIGSTAGVFLIAALIVILYKKDVFVARPPKGYKRIA
ncbi:MAG: extracellular solute-binding protein [Clostridia bacterium]|nr:extracellular solute-binding protein [Clostridia bacterium]